MNNTLAIVQAAMLPDVNFIQGKNIEQQQLQSMLRLRELAIKQKTALSNQIKALLLEFNIRISGKGGCVTAAIQAFIEDAENELTFEFRKALSTACAQYQSLVESIKVYDVNLEKTANKHSDCKKLLKLEGVSTVNAVNLYIALGCAELGCFSKGKDASACIGLTPLQYSSGGKTKIGAIGKYVKNGVLRSQLIVGAMAAIGWIMKREAKTKKEVWIQDLVERRGKKCAAVALANKTVRTAFAMLTQGTEYKAECITA
jgi:transposase